MFLAASSHDFNIIAITETWLTSHILSSELFDSGYQVFRRDRVLNNNITRGGGVLLAIDTKIVSTEIILPYSNENAEQLCAVVTLPHLINLPKREIVFIVSYIPPQSRFELYQLHLRNIEYVVSSLTEFQTACILGDFNLGNVIWEYCESEQTLMPFNVHNSIETYFCDKMHSIGLSQINNIKNDINRTLDLVCVSDNCICNLHRCFIPLTAESVNHKALEILFTFYDAAIPGNDDEFYFDFKAASYIEIKRIFAFHTVGSVIRGP